MGEYNVEELLEYRDKLRSLPSKPLSLEDLLTSDECFGLTTASPLQRAICRVADGRSLGSLAHHPDIIEGIGSPVLQIETQPKELLILSGIRTAKSMIAAALAVHWTQTCDFSGLGPGETPRVAVVSLTVDLAKVVFAHIAGTCLAKQRLMSLVVGEPTNDTIVLKNPRR